MNGRRRAFIALIIVGALVLVVVGLAAVRYFTFDPVAWAAGVNDELSPPTMRRAAASASAQTPASTDGKPDADLETWKARTMERAKAMRARFHRGGAECVRYGGGDDPAPAAVDEAAEAILGGGLAPQLGELIADAARWRTEADDRAHAADVSTEVMTYFGENAGPWQRLGLRMHRGAALAALRKYVGEPPPPSERHVRPESTARAHEVADRYGRALLPAAMKITQRVRTVDLRAPKIAFLSPGMPEGELESLLGTPAERTNDTWAWSDPPVEVLLDDRHEVIAVSRAMHEGREALVAGDSMLPSRDEGSLVGALGSPQWSHDDGANREVVWEAGPLRRRVLFERGALSRVELWKKERLTPPK